jgi:methylenetetrahydrofolate dehydrogenase (NADP+) / methenyltetrahydrofolate cyclohydrolase
MKDIHSNIIDGKYFANKILGQLSEKIDLVKNDYGIIPRLAIILVGQDLASVIYVRNKLQAAEQVGINAFQINFDNNISIEDLLIEIQRLNADPTISGIIVQLPLPEHIDKATILSAIAPNKDVDGFHPINVGYLNSGSQFGFVPSTALGVLELIKQYESSLPGKLAVIISRSNIVGRPLAALLLQEDCTVIICHSKTKNLSKINSEADIVISGIGIPYFLTKEYFNDNCIVIDVGINRDSAGKIAGDVNFIEVHDKVRYITPVPGGVGPMTIAFLLKNTFKSLLNMHNITLI